ncbi:MAG: lactonase family protein [Gallionella sp.]|nr:lactonase family protein [Gallionella sp.]
MKTKYIGIALAWLVTSLLLAACGGGDGSGVTGIYNLSGQFQKGPFVIGSQVSVNELDESLNPTGIVYNVQTYDDLGKFTVASKIGKHLVEVVGDGFYMDELTGQLATTRIQLRAVADLNINSIVTVNILTSLQSQRLKALLLQGSSYAAANTQSQNEVLAAFGIDYTKVNGLSTLYSMKIDGTTDADSVLLAVSTILSQMATNAAIANSTSQPAELSNYVNTIAAQIANTGTITSAATITSRNLAATQIDLTTVRTNIETYYANRGVTIVAPKFEEWVDKSGSGILPQRLVPVTGLTFIDVAAASPVQLITSNPITVAGLGAGIVAPVTVNTATTIIINSVAVSGTSSTVQDGDTIAMRVTSLGYSLMNSATISVGSTSATWHVTTSPLGGTISGLTGTGLVLQNNAGDNITIPANSTSFSFPASVAIGASYNVTVLTQPSTPLQVCEVNNGTSTVDASVNNISLICVAASGLAYISHQGSNFISSYSINANSGSLTLIGTNTTGTAPTSITLTLDGKLLYVANRGAVNTPAFGTIAGSISAFGISATGTLTPIGTYAAGTTPTYAITDPSGKFLYVANNGSDDVSAFGISATGTLTPIGTYTAGTAPGSITVDPSGKFLYVANNGSDDVSAFGISATGTLTPIGVYTAGTLPSSVIVDPSGKFLYVYNNVTNTPSSITSTGSISAFGISATGTLTPINTYTTGTAAAYTQGAAPGSITIDPSGQFLYVANFGSDDVSAFGISATGTLTPIGTYTAGTFPISVSADPSGKFLIAANYGSSNYSAYSISITGALTPISTFTALGNPYFIAVGRAP